MPPAVPVWILFTMVLLYLRFSFFYCFRISLCDFLLAFSMYLYILFYVDSTFNIFISGSLLHSLMSCTARSGILRKRLCITRIFINKVYQSINQTRLVIGEDVRYKRVQVCVSDWLSVRSPLTSLGLFNSSQPGPPVSTCCEVHRGRSKIRQNIWWCPWSSQI